MVQIYTLRCFETYVRMQNCIHQSLEHHIRRLVSSLGKDRQYMTIADPNSINNYA